jgi:hypothetical protein
MSLVAKQQLPTRHTYAEGSSSFPDLALRSFADVRITESHIAECHVLSVILPNPDDIYVNLTNQTQSISSGH